MYDPVRIASAVVGGVGALIILVGCGLSVDSAAGAVIWGCIWMYEGKQRGN